VARLRSNLGVPTGDEIGITGPADSACEGPWQPKAMALGDTSCTTDVRTSAFLAAGPDGVTSHRLEAFDALAGNRLLVRHR